MLSLWYVKREKGWQTFKRPGVDAFLEHLAQFYEIVIYSDEQSMVIWLFTPYSWSLNFSCLYNSYHYLAFYWYVQFVDPVVERLDPKHCIRYRLSKGATKYQNGKHYRVCSSWWLHIISTELCFILCMRGFKMIGISEFYLLSCSLNYLVFSAFCLFPVIFMLGNLYCNVLYSVAFFFLFKCSIMKWKLPQYIWSRLAIRHHMLLKQLIADEKWVVLSMLVVLNEVSDFDLIMLDAGPDFYHAYCTTCQKGPLLYATICNRSNLLMAQIGLQNIQKISLYHVLGFYPFLLDNYFKKNGVVPCTYPNKSYVEFQL